MIRDQIRSLKSPETDFLVLSGDTPARPFPADTARIPELAYDRDVPGTPEPESISDAILNAIHRQWAGGADIIHVHNPTLAKNRLLQAVLKLLQRKGGRLLCQIHDFAEDGRPDVFFTEPYVKDCHYTAINPRDRQLLIAAGLDPRGCHLLPNAVSPVPPPASTVAAGDTILYPVRAIRRKNIGEAILLSLWLPPGRRLAVTLPPNSPKDIAAYEDWRAFVARRRLDVSFEAGLAADFSALMNGCRYVLTTSINEGFGFCFLEAWINGKALWGRSLPHICRGFVQNGLRLDHLYRRLKVPLDWLEVPVLKQAWQKAMVIAMNRFHGAGSPETAAEAWETVSAGGRIDFGCLDESFQRAVIRRLIDGKHARKRLVEDNPFLLRFGPPQAPEALIAHNRSVVETHYSPRQYGRRLKNIYHRVIDTPVHHQIDKQILARAFLVPQDFSLLKWGS